MASGTITLAIEGEVSLARFVAGMRGFGELVLGLTVELRGKERVDWTVEELRSGSAVITASGTADREDVLDRVVSAYENVGQALSAHEVIPYSDRVSRAAHSIEKLIGEAITALRFETSNRDFMVLSRAEPKPTAPPDMSYGAIEGRVQMVTSRNSLRFTLYDILFDRAVSCYLEKGREDLMRDAWGHRAIVEGLISRDSQSGRPIAIRQIRQVGVIPDPVGGSYRKARASLPANADSPLPEKAIRLLRDA
jgi:hypothetical protein